MSIPEKVGGVVESARTGAGSILDSVSGLVEHVTPDGIDPFGGGVVPDVAGQLVDPTVTTTLVDATATVIQWV